MMFWLITITGIWLIALGLLWSLIWRAKRINERFDRDAAEYIKRLLEHAESRGLEYFQLNTKPSFLETELLTSRRKAADALGKEEKM